MLSHVQTLGFVECNHVRQSWKGIKTNHFDDRLWLRHFKMIKPSFEMPCNEIGSLVNPMTSSVEEKSFAAHGGIYAVNVFPS